MRFVPRGDSFLTQQYATIIDTPVVHSALREAWEDSRPGVSGGHEEGGFILRDSSGNIAVVRWPIGAQNSIILPAHPNCRINETDILATFHTHPNTGANYLQEPSETDKRAVRDDPDLKGELYVGEFVISQTKVYLITPTGDVSEIGDTQTLLFL